MLCGHYQDTCEVQFQHEPLGENHAYLTEIGFDKIIFFNAG